MSWEAPGSNKYQDDKTAYLFSLDNKVIYPVKNSSQAVYHYSKNYVFCFGDDVLSIVSDPINALNCGLTKIKDDYGIELNILGNNPLTGQSENGGTQFTCKEIEVFQVII